MATSSIKAPIRVVTENGAKALCDAYEKGIDDEARVSNGDRGVLSGEKSQAGDEIRRIFSLLGL